MTKANDSEVKLDDDAENTVTKSSENNQENNMISKIILTCKDKNMLMDQYDLLKDKYKNNPNELEMVRKITASRLTEFLKDGSLKPEEYEKMLDDMSRREPDFAVILLHSLFHAIEMDKQGVAKQNEYNKAKYEHDKQRQSQQGGGRSGLFNFGGGSIKEPKLVEPNENLSKTIEQSHRIMSSLLSGSDVTQESQNILNSLKEYSAFNNLHYMDFNHHLDTIKKYDEQKEQRENLDFLSRNTNLSDEDRNQAIREKEKLLTPDDVEKSYANARISLSKIVENNNIEELNEESMDDFMKGLGMKEEGDGIIFYNNVKKIIEHEEKTGDLLPQDNPFANFFSKLKSMFSPSSSANMQP